MIYTNVYLIVDITNDYTLMVFGKKDDADTYLRNYEKLCEYLSKRAESFSEKSERLYGTSTSYSDPLERLFKAIVKNPKYSMFSSITVDFELPTLTVHTVKYFDELSYLYGKDTSNTDLGGTF